METSRNYKGYTINIKQDDFCESPDNWGNEDTFIVYDHRQFTVKRDGFDPQELFEDYMCKGLNQFGDYWIFPLFAYIHSGVALSTSNTQYPFTCGFDTSLSGCVLVKKQEGWTETQTKAYEVAQSVVNTWNQYLSGEVYGYEVVNPEGEEIHACWGYYGESEYIFDCAKAEIDCDIKERIKDKITLIKKWIKAKVPFIYRENMLRDL